MHKKKKKKTSVLSYLAPICLTKRKDFLSSVMILDSAGPQEKEAYHSFISGDHNVVCGK